MQLVLRIVPDRRRGAPRRHRLRVGQRLKVIHGQRAEAKVRPVESVCIITKTVLLDTNASQRAASLGRVGPQRRGGGVASVDLSPACRRPTVAQSPSAQAEANPHPCHPPNPERGPFPARLPSLSSSSSPNTLDSMSTYNTFAREKHSLQQTRDEHEPLPWSTQPAKAAGAGRGAVARRAMAVVVLALLGVYAWQQAEGVAVRIGFGGKGGKGAVCGQVAPLRPVGDHKLDAHKEIIFSRKLLTSPNNISAGTELILGALGRSALPRALCLSPEQLCPCQERVVRRPRPRRRTRPRRSLVSVRRGTQIPRKDVPVGTQHGQARVCQHAWAGTYLAGVGPVAQADRKRRTVAGRCSCGRGG